VAIDANAALVDAITGIGNFGTLALMHMSLIAQRVYHLYAWHTSTMDMAGETRPDQTRQL